MAFYPTKSKVMVFGETKAEHNRNSPNRQWNIGGQTLPETSSVTHVGVVLNKFSKGAERTQRACQKARNTLMSLLNCGLWENGITPLTAVHLYKTVVIPRALHSCELWSEIDNV